jgi:quercetin dioxygenase-like cupin family protein
VAPGGQVGRHMHPVPLFVYILEGTLTIDMEQHGVHAFKAGEGLAEVIHTWHNGRNLGDKPCKFLIVLAGQKGTPNLIRP